jgi:hypothetical protein
MFLADRDLSESFSEHVAAVEGCCRYFGGVLAQTLVHREIHV